MKKLLFALSLVAALSGCAQLQDGYYENSAEAGPSSPEQHSPYPTRFKNDHYYPL
jgi:hypothetical protein